MSKKNRRIEGHIIIVAATTNANGEPDFAITAVPATEEEVEKGEHYEAAETKLMDDDYEGPFVLWDEDECPPWLFENVCKHLGVKNINDLAEEIIKDDDKSDLDDDEFDEDTEFDDDEFDEDE